MSSYLELVRQIEYLRGEIERLKTLESPRLNSVINDFLLIPGLVGFWPMSSVQRSTGNAYDLSGQGRTLTYNGNPTYNIHNNLAPYVDLDGTGDYLSRADETDLDILGTETIFASAVRGLTLGGWFWFNNAAGSTESLLTKDDVATNNRSYGMRRQTGGEIIAYVSPDGTGGSTVIVTGATPSVGSWVSLIMRFTPSSELAIFSDGTKAVNVSGIPASIFNGNAPFQVGAANGLNLLTGRASLCFLCANALPDDLAGYLYRRSKPLFI